PGSLASQRKLHRDVPPFPTRRSSDLTVRRAAKSSGISRACALILISAASTISPCTPSAGATWRSARSAASTLRSRKAVALAATRSEEHTSELQSRENIVCRLLLEKKK